MRFADRPRQDMRIAELEMLALEAERLAGPRAFQNFDGLQRPAQPFLARDLKTLELLLAVAQSDSQPQPPVRDDVDKRGVLRQAQRMIKRREQDVGADRSAR